MGGDIPGGPIVKNSPSRAGDVGLILGLGPKLTTTTTEPACSRDGTR